MSDLDLALQVEAAVRGRAVPRMGRLHVAVRPDARVLTLVALAGEDTDVHIALFGPVGREPAIGFVPDPRHRDDLFRMYRGLLAHVESYYAACLKAGTHPQVWVSSASAARHVEALAERLRNARADADVRRLGDLLTYPAERFYVAGQQSLVAATTALRTHYASGQQPSEDEHLGALLSWVDPPRVRAWTRTRTPRRRSSSRWRSTPTPTSTRPPSSRSSRRTTGSGAARGAWPNFSG